MAAAFTSPMSAVEAAVDAQRELELPVRMGLATGEAELRRNSAALRSNAEATTTF
jgi:class 3 adenylate cyclase